ncbi:helix-turn-helix domain-containing protein [Euzebya sp.]|uniref:TetR/AcrR family transcriptional regulator n=1 Tax=Euzebya sp. TaxID=1971409 RepID=UPI003511E675
MPTPDGAPPRAPNRGPAAAADNRRALLDAARRLFAEQGLDVPYRAIALEAGVGQGSLYRHFPTRLDLALAIFQENFTELEAAAASPGPSAFADVWRLVIEQTLASAAFVEVAVQARRELDDDTMAGRLADVLAGPLDRAQAAGLVDARWDVDQLVLVHRMAYGVLVTEVDPERARAAVLRALALVDPALADPLTRGATSSSG